MKEATEKLFYFATGTVFFALAAYQVINLIYLLPSSLSYGLCGDLWIETGFISAALKGTIEPLDYFRRSGDHIIFFIRQLLTIDLLFTHGTHKASLWLSLALFACFVLLPITCIAHRSSPLARHEKWLAVGVLAAMLTLLDWHNNILILIHYTWPMMLVLSGMSFLAMLRSTQYADAGDTRKSLYYLAMALAYGFLSSLAFASGVLTYGVLLLMAFAWNRSNRIKVVIALMGFLLSLPFNNSGSMASADIYSRFNGYALESVAYFFQLVGRPTMAMQPDVAAYFGFAGTLAGAWLLIRFLRNGEKSAFTAVLFGSTALLGASMLLITLTRYGVPQEGLYPPGRYVVLSAMYLGCVFVLCINALQSRGVAAKAGLITFAVLALTHGIITSAKFDGIVHFVSTCNRMNGSFATGNMNEAISLAYERPGWYRETAKPQTADTIKPLELGTFSLPEYKKIGTQLDMAQHKKNECAFSAPMTTMTFKGKENETTQVEVTLAFDPKHPPKHVLVTDLSGKIIGFGMHMPPSFSLFHKLQHGFSPETTATDARWNFFVTHDVWQRGFLVAADLSDGDSCTARIVANGP